MPPDQNSAHRFLLLYGSQTGQAEAISEELRDRASALGLCPDFQCMKETDRSFNLERERLAVIVISTTGDGDTPDNAQKLLRRLRKRTLTRTFLQNLSYCLLALGDSNYLNFCNCGKQFDKRLEELGARRFQKTEYADDAVGLEVVADPWLDRTLEYVIEYFGIKVDAPITNNLTMSGDNSAIITLQHSSQLEGLELNIPPLTSSYIDIEYTSESVVNFDHMVLLKSKPTFTTANSDILIARCTGGKRMTKSPLVKEYIELSFKVPNSMPAYRPGDAFGFLPQNDSEEVESILKSVEVLDKADLPCCITANDTTHNIPSHLMSHASLRFFLTWCCDIRLPPKKAFLRSLAEHAKDAQEKRRLLELCSRQGNAEFLKLIRCKHVSILDLLNAFPSCQSIPITLLLENLPRLQPRYYSVSSSPLEDAHSFTVVFSVVKIESVPEKIGVCSGYLSRTSRLLSDKNEKTDVNSLVSEMNVLKLEDNEHDFLIFKRKSSNFVLPEDNSTPLIMIGPGAGVAPFLGFLRHRQKLKEHTEETFGETWLYFGCRHEEHDFLYQDDLKSFLSDGILSHLRLSFSRDSNSASRYVQDNISKDFDSLLELIDNMNAIVFVCGDARNMGKDVTKTLVECYEKVKKVTAKDATLWLSHLQNSKRYIQDLWL